MDIINRKQAKQINLKYYFTGKPCKYEHIAERRVSNFACRVCEKTHSTRWYADNMAYYKSYYATHRKRLLEYSRKYWNGPGKVLNAKRKLKNKLLNV